MLTYQQKISLIQTTPELGPKGNKVWSILKAMMVEAWRAGREFVTPKNGTLARMAQCHQRTVQRTVHILERAGILKVTERFVIVGKQAIQLSNRLSVALLDVQARIMAATGKKPKHDKFVIPITNFISGYRYIPSKPSQVLGNKGLRHNLG